MWPFTAVVAVGYALLYFLTAPAFPSLPPTQRRDARSRVPSFANVAVCLWACYQCRSELLEAALDLESAAFQSSPQRDSFLQMVSGYMIYDLFFMALASVSSKEPSDWAMILHHFVVIAALELGVANSAGTFYMCVLFINEASTIFLNIR